MQRRHRHLREQEDQLRKIAESRAFKGLVPGSAAVMVAAMATFWSIDNQTLRVVCLFLAACSAIALVAAWASAGHLRNAAAGTRRGRREPATLTLRKDEDSDAICLGRLKMTHNPRCWRLVLATAPGQPSPESGTYEAQAVFLIDLDWPVLVYCGDILLWPLQTPKPGDDAVSR